MGISCMHKKFSINNNCSSVQVLESLNGRLIKTYNVPHAQAHTSIHVTTAVSYLHVRSTNFIVLLLLTILVELSTRGGMIVDQQKY